MQTIHNGDATAFTVPQVFSDLTGNISTGQLPSSGVPISNISATGIASSSTYLRGDGSWSTPSGGGGGITSIDCNSSTGLQGGIDCGVAL